MKSSYTFQKQKTIGMALEQFSKGQFHKNTVYLKRGMPYSCFLSLCGFTNFFHRFE